MTHHAHHDDDPHATSDTPGATFDPVCRHWVVPDKAHGTSTVDGTTVHFCSIMCKRAFDKDPARFLPIDGAQARASAMPKAKPSRATMGFLDKIRGSAAPAGTATDPVCHMKVDPARAAGQSEHGGETYYFCSAGCKTKFDADPHRFMGPHSHGGSHEHSH